MHQPTVGKMEGTIVPYSGYYRTSCRANSSLSVLSRVQLSIISRFTLEVSRPLTCLFRQNSTNSLHIHFILYFFTTASFYFHLPTRLLLFQIFVCVFPGRGPFLVKSPLHFFTVLIVFGTSNYQPLHIAHRTSKESKHLTYVTVN